VTAKEVKLKAHFTHIWTNGVKTAVNSHISSNHSRLDFSWRNL